MIANVVLEKTDLGEQWVLLSLAAVAVLVGLSLHRRVRLASHQKFFWTVAALVPVASGVLFAIWPREFYAYCREGHLVEWLTAELLFMGGVVGLAAMVRLIQQRRPLPMTLFLTIFCFLACGREMEWGEAFVGEKIFYTRFLFRPKAYFDPGHFDGLARDIGFTVQYLYSSFVVFMLIAIVVLTVLIVYLVRHQKVFLRELRTIPKMPWGQYFLAGCGLYLFAQLASEIVENCFKPQLRAMSLGERFVNEPLELLAAMFFARAMVGLWHLQRCYLPVSAVQEVKAIRARLGGSKASSSTPADGGEAPS